MLGKETDQRNTAAGIRPFGWVVLIKRGDVVLASRGNINEAETNLEKVLSRTKQSELDTLHRQAEARVARKD